MSLVQLRDVTGNDLPFLFEQQLDPEANRMAAFTALNPSDREAFMRKWAGILGDEAMMKQTILFDGRVAGHILSFVAPWSGEREVTYWLGKEYWGKGIATQALEQFLRRQTARPLHARAAKDNVASIRVLEKCGFVKTGEDKGFANARGGEIEEVVMEL